MDVNYNSQLGTSIPLADIVETGSRYIKFSNGIAIVWSTMPGIVSGSHKIATGIYEWRMILKLLTRIKTFDLVDHAKIN